MWFTSPTSVTFEDKRVDGVPFKPLFVNIVIKIPKVHFCRGIVRLEIERPRASLSLRPFELHTQTRQIRLLAHQRF